MALAVLRPAREVPLVACHEEVCVSTRAREAPPPLDHRAAYLVQAHTVLQEAVVTTTTEILAEAVQAATRVL